MSSAKSPKERATRKKTHSSAGKVLQGVTATVGAAAAAAAVKSSKHKRVAAVVAAICFILGIAGGWFGIKIFTKDDGFKIIGEDFIEIQINEFYTEEGASAVFFGRDCTENIKITYSYRYDITHDATACEGVDTSVEGFYYAVYTNDAFPYKGIDLIRTIQILRVEDDGQAE